jgi:HEXXH motif-containing protein
MLQPTEPSQIFLTEPVLALNQSALSASCREQIKDAFALMDQGDPGLAAEIRALVLEIILAAATENPKTMTFDGASAFMLWGAIMINANRRDGAVGMVQMLAHESAHDLLFGLCATEPLVENAPDELFLSPLRIDPRPMEGIYHATFVTARMQPNDPAQHAGPGRVDRAAELRASPRVGCSASLCENSFFDHSIRLLLSSKFAISKI